MNEIEKILSKKIENIKSKEINIFSISTSKIVEKMKRITDIRERLKMLQDMNIIQTIKIAGPEYTAIDYSGRKIVIAKIGDVKIPFYLSTGLGGKKNVESGKWYAFFGLGEDTGWFNKGAQPDQKISQELINAQYNNPELQKIAKILNEGISEINTMTNGKINEGYWQLQDNPESLREFNKNLEWDNEPKNNLRTLMSASHVEEILLKLKNESMKHNGK